MKKFTYGAYDWIGNLIELSIIAEDRATAGKIVRGILENSREYINVDDGIFLNDESEV